MREIGRNKGERLRKRGKCRKIQMKDGRQQERENER
jgi:hypothetical protein